MSSFSSLTRMSKHANSKHCYHNRGHINYFLFNFTVTPYKCSTIFIHCVYSPIRNVFNPKRDLNNTNYISSVLMVLQRNAMILLYHVLL